MEYGFTAEEILPWIITVWTAGACMGGLLMLSIIKPYWLDKKDQ